MLQLSFDFCDYEVLVYDVQNLHTLSLSGVTQKFCVVIGFLILLTCSHVYGVYPCDGMYGGIFI